MEVQNFGNLLVVEILFYVQAVGSEIQSDYQALYLHRQSSRGKKLTDPEICLKTLRISFWITVKSFFPIILPFSTALPFASPSYWTLKSHRSSTSFVTEFDITSDIFCNFFCKSQPKKLKFS